MDRGVHGVTKSWTRLLARTHSSFCILTPLHGCSFSRYSDLRHLLVVLFRGSTLALIIEKVSSTLDPGQVVR